MPISTSSPFTGIRLLTQPAVLLQKSPSVSSQVLVAANADGAVHTTAPAKAKAIDRKRVARDENRSACFGHESTSLPDVVIRRQYDPRAVDRQTLNRRLVCDGLNNTTVFCERKAIFSYLAETGVLRAGASGRRAICASRA